MAETLDFALKERLRAVLERQSVTEAELRKLSEEARAGERIIAAELERSEQELADLAADPAGPLTEIAAALREASDLRPRLDELRGLLDELDGKARELRATWLSTP